MTPAAIFSCVCLALAAVLWVGFGLVVPGGILCAIGGWGIGAWLEAR